MRSIDVTLNGWGPGLSNQELVSEADVRAYLNSRLGAETVRKQSSRLGIYRLQHAEDALLTERQCHGIEAVEEVEGGGSGSAAVGDVRGSKRCVHLEEQACRLSRTVTGSLCEVPTEVSSIKDSQCWNLKEGTRLSHTKLMKA